MRASEGQGTGISSIKAGLRKRGDSESVGEEIAARTENKAEVARAVGDDC